MTYSLTKLHETLKNYGDTCEPLVALKQLDQIDYEIRQQLKLTSYMRRHALLDAVHAEGNQARVGREIGLSRQRTHDMVERAQFERLHKVKPPLGEGAV